MVNSVAPGALGVNISGVVAGEARATREGVVADANTAKADSVMVSKAPLVSARESVLEALRQVELARDLARDAHALAVTAQNAARGEASQADLDAAVTVYARKFEVARAEGGVLIAGQDVVVQAEPGAAALVIGGADMGLAADPADTAVIQVSQGVAAEDPKLAEAAQASLERLQAVLGRLSESAKALSAHHQFLGAAEAALGARADLSADSARLLALQVRQGLEQSPGVAIANFEPQSVLALFRA